ncbi:MAG: polymerase sigma-70 factor, subfamily [Acidimicrobiaceae bacterium]|jgi:RNA polymerase sigma-70 factor (ECF subfamily)
MVDSVTPDAGFALTLASAQAGDEPAIVVLYRAYNPALLRFFAVQAPRVKEDLAQEVWAAVASSLTSFEGDEGRFRAWLFTIARRRSIDYWRLVRRRPPEASDELIDFAQAEQPDDLAIRAAVSELTAGLTAEQAEVVLLRVVAGLSVEHVAAIVHKSPGAVRVIQHRALRRLAQLTDRVVTP